MPWLAVGAEVTRPGTPRERAWLEHGSKTDVLRVEQTSPTAPPVRARAELPEAETSDLFGAQVDWGQAGSTFVVRQESGDSTRWLAYLLVDDELQQMSIDAPVGFGSGYLESGSDYRRFDSWIADGEDQVFTRVATGTGDGVQPFEIYRWAINGPGEGGASPASSSWQPRLQALEVGTVCLDPAQEDPRPVGCP